MAREIDPNNLSGRDVARILAPTIGFVVAFVAVGRYAPQFIWVLFAALFVFMLFSVRSIPKKNLEVIAESQQRTNEKIKNLPVLGPIIYPLWRVLGWLSGLFTAATITLLVYFIYKGIT